MNLKLYIPTCDRYNWLIKPFSFTFNKFWDNHIQVVYLGYTKPDFDLPENFKFISLGEDDSLDNWSIDLKKYFDTIDDEWLMMTVDDSFSVRDTNTELYNQTLNYLLNSDKKIGRFGLERDLVTRPNKYWDTHDGVDLVEAEPSADNRISMRWSIWRREYLVKHFVNGRTPWTFESDGTNDSKNDGWAIISYDKKNPPNPPDNSVVFNTNALWRSWYEDFNRVNVMDCSKESPNDRLDNETLKEMKELNYFNKEVEFGSICNKNWFPINLED